MHQRFIVLCLIVICLIKYTLLSTPCVVDAKDIDLKSFVKLSNLTGVNFLYVSEKDAAYIESNEMEDCFDRLEDADANQTVVIRIYDISTTEQLNTLLGGELTFERVLYINKLIVNIGNLSIYDSLCKRKNGDTGLADEYLKQLEALSNLTQTTATINSTDILNPKLLLGYFCSFADYIASFKPNATTAATLVPRTTKESTLLYVIQQIHNVNITLYDDEPYDPETDTSMEDNVVSKNLNHISKVFGIKDKVTINGLEMKRTKIFQDLGYNVLKSALNITHYTSFYSNVNENVNLYFDNKMEQTGKPSSVMKQLNSLLRPSTWKNLVKKTDLNVNNMFALFARTVDYIQNVPMRNLRHVITHEADTWVQVSQMLINSHVTRQHTDYHETLRTIHHNVFNKSIDLTMQRKLAVSLVNPTDHTIVIPEYFRLFDLFNLDYYKDDGRGFTGVGINDRNICRRHKIRDIAMVIWSYIRWMIIGLPFGLIKPDPDDICDMKSFKLVDVSLGCKIVMYTPFLLPWKPNWVPRLGMCTEYNRIDKVWKATIQIVFASAASNIIKVHPALDQYLSWVIRYDDEENPDTPYIGDDIGMCVTFKGLLAWTVLIGSITGFVSFCLAFVFIFREPLLIISELIFASDEAYYDKISTEMRGDIETYYRNSDQNKVVMRYSDKYV